MQMTYMDLTSLYTSNFNFRYVRLYDLDKEKWPNCLQTVETLIRCCILQCLIWVCTVCQLPFLGFPDKNGLNYNVVLLFFRYTVFNNGSLYFPKVRNTDEGGYRCEGLSSQRDKPAQIFIAELAISCKYA